MVKFHLEFRQLWCQLDISRSRKYFMKFEVSILVILAVRFGIPHVFVFSKSVYLTRLSLIPLFFYGSIYFQKRSHFLFSYVFAIISPLHGNVQPGQRFWVRFTGFEWAKRCAAKVWVKLLSLPSLLLLRHSALEYQKKKSTNKKNRRLRVQARKCLKSIKF